MLPIASVCSNLVQYFMSVLIFVIYRWGIMPFIFHLPGHVFTSPGPPPLEVVWLPALLFLEFLLICGVSFIVSALNAFYEDVKFIVQMFMNMLFYLLPIMYFAENIFYSKRIPEAYRSLAYHVYLANPLAWIITAYKQIFFRIQNIAPRGAVPILSAPFDYRFFAITAVVCILICLFGYAFFNRYKWRFVGEALSDYAIEVEGIVKDFRVYHRSYSTLKGQVAGAVKARLRGEKHSTYDVRRVLNGVSFRVKQGEAVGIVGRNGSGKSTLLSILSEYLPTLGKARLNGRVIGLLELGAGFHPEMTGMENIYFNAAVLGLRTRRLRDASTRSWISPGST